MNKRYEHTGVYAFLEANGAATATPEQLTKLRKEYWRDWKRRWKAEKRRDNYSVTLFFSDRELALLDRSAKKVKTSRPRFIKKMALLDFSMPDTAHLRSILIGNYEALLTLCQHRNVPVDIGAQLLCRMEALEQAIISQLQLSIANDH